MGIRRLFGLTDRAVDAPTSRVISEGQDAECISIRHHDGSISEVRVSADNDDLNIDVHPALRHSPHLTGGYL